jgi:hypothetical protein
MGRNQSVVWNHDCRRDLRVASGLARMANDAASDHRYTLEWCRAYLSRRLARKSRRILPLGEVELRIEEN